MSSSLAQRWVLVHNADMADLTRDSSPSVHRWNHSTDTDEVAIVLPDGCIDLIVHSCSTTGNKIACITNWDLVPRSTRLTAGSFLTGYRLRPGIVFDVAETEIAKCVAMAEEIEIESMTRQDQEISEIIDALCLPGSSLYGIAKQQGVSERTLQRHFRKRSLPNPNFWRQLGRARRAVQALPCRVGLSDVAHEYGYSDQAHMTREFVRWFGRTPVQLRRSPIALNDLLQPGLGNWSD